MNDLNSDYIESWESFFRLVKSIYQSCAGFTGEIRIYSPT